MDNILENLINHIKKHNLKTTPEQIFAEFMAIVKWHSKFREYLKTSGILCKLNKMKRNERLKERRKLFIRWYFNLNKNEQSKVLQMDLSDMIFVFYFGVFWFNFSRF